MKNIYTKIFLLSLFILQLYLPATLHAQCLCDGAVPATPIKQNLAILPSTTSTLTFSFHQFDPTIGTLSCVTLNDTISGISTTGALNKAIVPKAYKFQLTLSNNISGPGISIDETVNKPYGPDTLAAYGNAADTVTYGPDAIFLNDIGSAQTGGNAAYLGTGTVDFVYTINGGMIATQGGTNYTAGISTTMSGNLGLIYYYCPLALLANKLKNFSAVKNNNNVLLKWDAQGTDQNDQFNIEYSTNGVDFIAVAKVAGDQSAAGVYSYNYLLNNTSNSVVYFRVKQTSADKKVGYSGIQKVQLGSKTFTGIAIRPNPAVTGISVSFDHQLTGDFSIDLVNMAGQVVINKKLRLENSSLIPLNWSSKPAPGIYFTRITNTGSMEQQIARVVIQ